MKEDEEEKIVVYTGSYENNFQFFVITAPEDGSQSDRDGSQSSIWSYINLCRTWSTSVYDINGIERVLYIYNIYMMLRLSSSYIRRVYNTHLTYIWLQI